MRRITSACLLQTIRFDAIDETNPEMEIQVYCNKLDRKKTKYSIEEKKKEADGSIVVKIKKQYNTYRMEGYID